MLIDKTKPKHEQPANIVLKIKSNQKYIKKNISDKHQKHDHNKTKHNRTKHSFGLCVVFMLNKNSFC